MQRSTDVPSYSPLRIALHWVSAAVILWASFSGFTATMRSPADPFRLAIDAINPQLTTLFIPFFLWRCALYLHHRPWQDWIEATMESRVATLVHGLLYACILLVLMTGFLMMPHPWRLLGVVPMPHPIEAPSTLVALAAAHRALCVCLAALIGLHLLAVLKHHLLGDPVLSRMRLPHRQFAPKH